MKNRLFSIVLVLCTTFSMPAFAADVDVSGSYVIDHENGKFTFVIKGAAPIDLAQSDHFMLVCTDMAYDFTGVTVTTTAPLDGYGGMNQVDFMVQSAFTIPQTGLEIAISGVAYLNWEMSGPGNTMDLVIAGVFATIPVFRGSLPEAGFTLELSAPVTVFSPDWEGKLSAPVTVTVTAKDIFTGATGTEVNGRVALYCENGPVTLLNSQSYLYADMRNGTGTATINKLTDMGALKDPYNVDLKATMPLYNSAVSNVVTLSITPHPLSISGKVIDENGNDVVGATVMLLTADGYMASRTQTNHAGNFLLYGSPKSSSYRVIATYNDLYGEMTKNLLPQPATATITLYSQIKVEVNFYKNKATLDGTPNNNVMSPANLYPANTYTIEAYANAAGTQAIKPARTDGRDAYFQMADIANGGGKLYIKAAPYSKYQDPFIDNSSILKEVDYTSAPDPYNVKLDLEESPVGTITVKNTGTKAFNVFFESASREKYTEHNTTIQPGGMYAFAPPEGYKTGTNTVQVWFGYGYDYGDRYIATVGMGRKWELPMSAEDFVSYGTTSYRLTAGKQIGDVIPISLSFAGATTWTEDKQVTIELPTSLEMPLNWREYVSLSFCSKNITLSAEQINATYNSTANTLTFEFEKLFGHLVGKGWVSGATFNSAANSFWETYCYSTNRALAVMPHIFNFAVKATANSADVTSHHISAVITRLIRIDGRDSGNYVWVTDYNFYYLPTRYPLTSLSFTTGHPLTLEAPATTVSDKVFVQGYAKPNTAVTISADGYGALNTITCNSAGRYSGTVTLPKLETSKDIKLVATSEGKTSNKATVRYSKKLLYTKELWMNSKTTGQFEKSYNLINNSVMYDNGAPVIVDAQSGKTQNIMLGDEVKFRVKMSDDNAVQKVFVSMERADGQSLGSIPCLLQGSGFWESEIQEGMNGAQAASFRVAYVLNIGHEYLSPDEIEANMRESEAAMAAYIPPERMFTDPEAYENELRLAMLEALPPEMRNATVTPQGGNTNRISLNIGGQNVTFDQTIESVTGAAFDALAAKAQKDGLKLGGGEYYREVKYVCTLNSGTKTYTQEEFDRALYDQQQAHPTETCEQILGNRLNIKSIRMETTEYLSMEQGALRSQPIEPADAPLLGGAEGVRSVLEVGTAGAGVLLTGAAGTAVGGVNTVVSVLGLPDQYARAGNFRDVYNNYQAMYDNFNALEHTACYADLDPMLKVKYVQLRQEMEQRMDDAKFLKHLSYFSAGSSTMSTVGSAGATIATASGAGTGFGIAANVINAISSTLSNAFGMDKMFQSELMAQRNFYNDTRALNDAFRASTAYACGEKESDKTQGNYNFIYDPQGTVYDGTLDYPVANVRAELWTATDGNGTAARYWNEAADYDQINPQITDADGMFSWFTPEGWWQVRVFDYTGNVKGAELGRSDWLKVLPPHFGVNINIGKEPVTITYDGNGGYLPMPTPEPGNEENPDDMFFNLADFPQTVFAIPQGKSHTAIENVFVRSDSTFTGWNTHSAGNGASYAAGAVIANIQADMTLYAQWKSDDNSIGDVEAGNSIVVYPNPTNGQLSIEIDVSGFPSGVYLVKIDTEQGEVTKRFVKN